MEDLPIGTRVERVNAPADSTVHDGAKGTIVRAPAGFPAGPGGAFVAWDHEPAGVWRYAAATRLRPIGATHGAGA